MARSVFVYEFACAGGGGGPVPTSIRVEGRAMLAAILDDLRQLPDVTTVTILDRLAEPDFPGQPFHAPVSAEAAVFRELASACDATLVIAPESDGILLARCQWVEEAGGRLLGPTPEAVRLTTDKLELGQFLTARGIPTPPCRSYVPGPEVPDQPFPAVWKPRDGAGSQATFLVRTPGELERCARQAREEDFLGEAILQPYWPGAAASVAFLVGPRQQLALLPGEQQLSRDGRLRYEGGTLPLPAALSGRTVRLARRAVAAVPGLTGYVGVDLVLGDQADGGRDAVIEINPRLTTSYVGLRRLARGNLMDALLRVWDGEVIPPPEWHPGPVHFLPDGRLSEPGTGQDASAERLG